MKYRIIRPKELQQILGVARSTIWQLEKDGILPKKVQLGNKSIGWRSDEIEAFIESRKGIETA